MNLSRALRARLRHGALDVLSWLTRDSIEPDLLKPRVHFPYLHTVPPNQEARFRTLLAELSATHTFIAYSEAVDRVTNGPVDRPYLSLSFDDGFKSNVRTARILDEFGIPGMFFVPPNFVGTESRSEAIHRFGFPPDVAEQAMTWADLESLVSRGHEVGNHTLDHDVISMLNAAEAHHQIEAAATALRARLGKSDHFAWPRGLFRHFTPQAAAYVAESGHMSCASAERGAHTAPIAPAHHLPCLRRDHLKASWPIRHSLYLLARSSKYRSSEASNNWPETWHVK